MSHGATKHCIKCKRTRAISRFYRNHNVCTVCNECESDVEKTKSDNIKSALEIFDKIGGWCDEDTRAVSH